MSAHWCHLWHLSGTVSFHQLCRHSYFLWRGSLVLQHVMVFPTSCFGRSSGRSAHGVCISSQQPGFACSPWNLGVGSSRASGAVLKHSLFFPGFSGRNTGLCFESRFLGCPPGLRPSCFWLELCIPCLASGSLMIFVRVLPFHTGHYEVSHFFSIHHRFVCIALSCHCFCLRMAI